VAFSKVARGAYQHGDTCIKHLIINSLINHSKAPQSVILWNVKSVSRAHGYKLPKTA